MFLRTLILMLILSCSGFAQQKPILLLTSFEPFDIEFGPIKDPETNYSDVFAKSVKIKLEKKFAGKVRIEHVTLPVSFNRSYKVMADFIKTLPTQPNWIVSLGQVKFTPIEKQVTGIFGKKKNVTEYNDKIKIETIARNANGTSYPDNDDFVPQSNSPSNYFVAIDPNQKSMIGFNIPVADIFCGLGESVRNNMMVSTSAGDYVCNNISFKTMNAISSGKLQSQFMFVHVPFFINVVETEEHFIEKNTKDLEKLLVQIVKKARPDPQGQKYMPTDLAELTELASRYEKRKDVSDKDLCLANFYMTMKARETPPK